MWSLGKWPEYSQGNRTRTPLELKLHVNQFLEWKVTTRLCGVLTMRRLLPKRARKLASRASFLSLTFLALRVSPVAKTTKARADKGFEPSRHEQDGVSEASPPLPLPTLMDSPTTWEDVGVNPVKC
jgi:hypothetical protein